MIYSLETQQNVPSTAQPEILFPSGGITTVIVFSHLRWDFVFQRPQHLLTRCARHYRVFYIEEPIIDAPHEKAFLEKKLRENGVTITVPHVYPGLSSQATIQVLKTLVDELVELENLHKFILWYYTPMALPFTKHLKAERVVYDCMDELSLFKDAPSDMLSNEAELFQRADIVFTGGVSLYEHKKNLHKNIHALPSSIDYAHFAKARTIREQEPYDQRKIEGRKIGFFGVIDERMDMEILRGIAQLYPNWNLIILGPVVKIDADSLPQAPNIFYLGSKSYQELPNYIAGWDVAILPFALNESTRYISPTKTPEYLAAGVPVVSTPIQDVITPYEDKGLVQIAATPEEFARHIEALFDQSPHHKAEWLAEVDKYLAQGSWDKTWEKMYARLRGTREPIELGASQSYMPNQHSKRGFKAGV